MSIVQHIFPGGKNFSRGASPPGYGPVYNSSENKAAVHVKCICGLHLDTPGLKSI